ncbi:hypothetical protein ABTM77_21370, partial [Acinetobacter baumannii]
FSEARNRTGAYLKTEKQIFQSINLDKDLNVRTRGALPYSRAGGTPLVQSIQQWDRLTPRASSCGGDRQFDAGAVDRS